MKGIRYLPFLLCGLIPFVLIDCVNHFEDEQTPQLEEKGQTPDQESWDSSLVSSDSGRITAEIEYGYICKDGIVNDVIDRSKEEVFANLRLYWTSTILAQSSYVAELWEELAAGYLIMKYWEGHPRGEDFWKYGRNLVDTAHKRITELKEGEKQLLTGGYDSTIRAAKEYLPFQYKILDHGKGLHPSGLYTQKAEDVDEETY